ncbi:MAG TPA: protein tyrosine phosphatase family protein [Puia sp.]|jgi:protein tyrosine phosphatase (PTP) superfamily phosphohydrolase (DUF442 family)|nr:protein tyrosine phosphatase family protein [Puia sp.]
MREIKNFLEISDRLACAGQPDESQLEIIADHGFEVVINLGLSDGKYALHDEAGSIAALGLQYYHIPVQFENPQLAEWKSFMETMQQHSAKATFVHCAANYRATAFTGLYLVATSQLKQEELYSFIAQIWQPNPVWQQFIEEAIQYINENHVP